MNAYRVKRLNAIDAAVTVPGSKSYTNRAFACAALAEGESVLHNVLMSDDTRAMLGALEKIGVWTHYNQNASAMKVIGANGHFLPYPGELYVQNAGTAMRFLASMLTLGKGAYLLSGNERMTERPIGDLVRALQSMGVLARAREDEFPPLTIESAGFPGGAVSIKGDVSSQYISSLLIVAPYGETPLTLSIDSPLVSRPYVDMTIDIMRAFGAEVSEPSENVFFVSNEQCYSGRDYAIESDATNASYFLAIPALIGGRARVENISYASKQGDVKFVDALERMGCAVERGTDYLEVRKDKAKELTGITIDMVDMPDVAQTLAVVALTAKTPTTVTGAQTLRVKETDRIQATVNEIRALGGNAQAHDDGFTVFPLERYHGAEIHTYDDHRMAMAFSLAGLFIDDVVILDPGCVSKTFPTYFSVLDNLYDAQTS